MAKDTGIQYANDTQNFWQGCDKVSPGCKFCYMFREVERWGRDPRKVVRSSTSTFNAPLHQKDPSTIFTCSWSDFFHEKADQWREDAWDVIRKTPQHDYQIFTKRVDLIPDRLPADWGEGYDNVIIMVSAENQEWLDRRIPFMRKFKAKCKGISMEPLLGPISIKDEYRDVIDWVIVGGESGFGSVPEQKGIKYGYRECEEGWIINIISDCRRLQIPVFVKQMGTHLAKKYSMSDYHGGKPDEFPLEGLKVFEYPKGYEKKR